MGEEAGFAKSLLCTVQTFILLLGNVCIYWIFIKNISKLLWSL